MLQTIVVVTILTTIFLLFFFAALIFGGTPGYRINRKQVLDLLGFAQKGTLSFERWYEFLNMPITTDEQLELVRIKCIEFEEKYGLGRNNRRGFLFDNGGLSKLGDLIDFVKDHDQVDF